MKTSQKVAFRAAAGATIPIYGLPPPAIPLIGDMWWEEDSDPGKLRECKLFRDRLYLDVESDFFRYRGTLKRVGTTDQYTGTLPIADDALKTADAGTVKASCTLNLDNGVYVLRGLWKSETGQFEWYAELEPSGR